MRCQFLKKYPRSKGTRACYWLSSFFHLRITSVSAVWLNLSKDRSRVLISKYPELLQEQVALKFDAIPPP